MAVSELCSIICTTKCNIINYLEDKVVKLQCLIEFFDNFGVFNTNNTNCNNSSDNGFKPLHYCIMTLLEKLVFAKNLRKLEI